ncbi:ASCH domain-containing protein [Rugosimonospora africana]|uniref:ASCH domain-containing protein n=1 Tax=Rugosimonospora africana TaxID=556532 RepID=A0A8J3VRE4_9ACTN|nr:ASCH domain-containing protein [Rugosimonospora africana]GIH16044.1 hypothetical protein Raf01_42160 [Rugosimonospora africana]
MTVQRTLLLSLRPRFADAILNGTKTIEIRRRPVNTASGTPIILYASSPMMAVVGTAQLAGVDVYTPETAWRKYRRTFGLTRAEYDAYLDGSDVAYLLGLHRVNSLNEPLPLRHLREEGPFRPPQSFRYIAASDPSRLKNLVPA